MGKDMAPSRMYTPLSTPPGRFQVLYPVPSMVLPRRREQCVIIHPLSLADIRFQSQFSVSGRWGIVDCWRGPPMLIWALASHAPYDPVTWVRVAAGMTSTRLRWEPSPT